MKKSELRNLIKEEIQLAKRTMIKEDIFDKIIDSIFGKIKDDQTKKAMKSIENDAEYQIAKTKLNTAIDNAKSIVTRLKKKYNIE